MSMPATIGPTRAIVCWIPHIVVISSGLLAFRLRQRYWKLWARLKVLVALKTDGAVAIV